MAEFTTDQVSPAAATRTSRPPQPIAPPRRTSVLTSLREALPTAAGLTILLIGVGAMGAGGWPQVLVLTAGAALLLKGVGQLARRRFGDHVDVTAWLCALWLTLLVSAAVLAPVLPIGEHQDLAASLTEPTMARPDLLSAHPLGTNNFGLDLLARVLYGARASLVVSIGAVLIGMAVGATIGIVAGFRRGPFDWGASVLTNSFLAVPPLILLIALATVLDPTLHNMAFALSLLAAPSMIRIARASTMALAEREFVLAGRAMGASTGRVMIRELLPNVALPLASYGMVMISVLIVAEASLSFLGLGVQAPAPSWGNMIAEGQGRVFEQHPHIVLVPGVVLFLTVFAFNALGERARTRFDSRAGNL